MLPGMPMNLATNDINFAGGQNQIRKFGVPGGGVGAYNPVGMPNQKLNQLPGA